MNKALELLEKSLQNIERQIGESATKIQETDALLEVLTKNYVSLTSQMKEIQDAITILKTPATKKIKKT